MLPNVYHKIHMSYYVTGWHLTQLKTERGECQPLGTS